MTAFITGSHAYGKPREDSDIDLAVLMGTSSIKALADASKQEVKEEYPNSASLRFGKLNLLCFAERRDFETWLEGTQALEARKPVTREEAVAKFEELEARDKAADEAGKAARLAGKGPVPRDGIDDFIPANSANPDNDFSPEIAW